MEKKGKGNWDLVSNNNVLNVRAALSFIPPHIGNKVKSFNVANVFLSGLFLYWWLKY